MSLRLISYPGEWGISLMMLLLPFFLRILTYLNFSLIPKLLLFPLFLEFGPPYSPNCREKSWLKSGKNIRLVIGWYVFLGAKIVMRSFILKYIITIFAPKSVMLFMICKRLRGLRNKSVLNGTWNVQSGWAGILRIGQIGLLCIKDF